MANNPSLILENLRPGTYNDPGVFDKLNYLESLFGGGGPVTFASITVTGNAALNTASGTTSIRATPDTTVQLLVDTQRTAQTTNWRTIKATLGGTFDTTGGVLAPIAVLAQCTATRSAGANNLTCTGLLGDATGGQVNVALQTNNGDVLLNNVGGTTTIKGATTIQNTLDMNTHRINNVTDPASAQDVATKNYIDTKAFVLLARQVITSSGTYTPTTGTKRVLVQMTGGGGGGGGAAGGANRSVGGGGGSGVYWEKFIDPAATVTGSTTTIGAAGAAGSSAGGNGGTGGDTSVIINSVTYTAKGGTGGTGNTNGTKQTPPGGVPQTGSSAADFTSGRPGNLGLNYDVGAFQWGGDGGSNNMGIGGTGAVTNGGTADAAGGDAGGRGGGGGGASATNTARAGGAGTAGLIIIWEYA